MDKSSKVNRLKAALNAASAVSCNISDKDAQELIDILENDYNVKLLENPYSELPVVKNMGPFKSGKERRRERRKQERSRRKAL